MISKDTTLSDKTDNAGLAKELTAAWLSNPNTRISKDDVPTFLRVMYEAISSLSVAPNTDAETATHVEYEPAVSVRKSLARRDVIISMIDGKPYKTLRRHLSGYGLTPETYRKRYGLKLDYPMTAPEYSEARRSMAKKIGLGRKPTVGSGAAKAAANGSTSKARRNGRPKAKPQT